MVHQLGLKITSTSRLNEGNIQIQVVRFSKNAGAAVVATLTLCKTTQVVTLP